MITKFQKESWGSGLWLETDAGLAKTAGSVITDSLRHSRGTWRPKKEGWLRIRRCNHLFNALAVLPWQQEALHLQKAQTSFMSLVVGAQESHLPLAAFLTQAPRPVLLIYPVSSLLYKEPRLHATVVRKFLLSDALGGSRVTPFMESRIGSSQEPTWVHVAPQDQATTVWTSPGQAQLLPYLWVLMSMTVKSLWQLEAKGLQGHRVLDGWCEEGHTMFRALMSLLAGHKAVRGGPFLNHEDAGNWNILDHNPWTPDLKSGPWPWPDPQPTLHLNPTLTPMAL